MLTKMTTFGFPETIQSFNDGCFDFGDFVIKLSILEPDSPLWKIMH